jgi:hypothetical protein
LAAQGDAAALAKPLSNPVATLISVPFQLNFDENIGRAEEGKRWTLNVQPVVPITPNHDWNVISRTIHRIALEDHWTDASAQDPRDESTVFECNAIPVWRRRRA